MIIKLTVKDNDFRELMNDFLCNLDSRVSQRPPNMNELDIDTKIKILESSEKVYRLLNPNVTRYHTDEDKIFLIEKIIEAFAIYVTVREDEKTADYLIRNFKVEILNSMTDRWENGEAFYWFQHSKVVINQ